MDSEPSHTSELIRRLSRRQWMIALAVAALTLGSLSIGWVDFTEHEESSEIINLAGRQRMLSQRIAMSLLLAQRESDPDRQRRYRDTAAAAADEFERAHARLAASAGRLGADSAIRSAFFGPSGRANGASRAYLFQVRAALEASAPGNSDDNLLSVTTLAAGGGLLAELDLSLIHI